MAKRIIGSYRSEATALQKIDQLLTEGYSKESITLVTNPNTKKTIQSQTNVAIVILSSVSKKEELHSVIPDEEILVDYKKAIEKGSTLILVDERPPSDDAAGINLTAPDLAAEDDPLSSSIGRNQKRSIRTQHLDYDDEDLITDINTDGDLEIEDDFPPTESPDRTDFY
ncbi:Heat induced stress protein YflT [Carnobacterium alterfunditum]|uniref:Heat induced stress protein YflT n=1 Tax=Carnobacterium alterfunditum TaxID=28230 RepID=A0A1N6G106_9LACT|nr:hypothetical protein [Carnobacterium alterfunditum]SIO01157.1 Heat induced stress protein YflT [Carnobacterium alterfunditum]